MNKSIGLYTYEFPVDTSLYGFNSRIAFFSKAIGNNDVANNFSFGRLLLNTILWSAKKRLNTNYFPVLIPDPENVELKNWLQSNITSIGCAPIFTSPWHKFTTTNVSSIATILLLPSHNAALGSRMPDAGQNFILNQVKQGVGLVVSEWFNYLQSIPAKRSFQYANDGTLSFGDYQNATNPSQGIISSGLFGISPFTIKNFIDIYSPDTLRYVRNQDLKFNDRDSIPEGIPFNVELNVGTYNVGFNADLSLLDTIRTPISGVIEYYTNLSGDIDFNPPTTTTVPPLNNIKLPIADINASEACGPYTIFLSGVDANKFSIDNNKLYLLENTRKEEKYNVSIVSEDFFRPKRYEDVVKTYNVNLIKCNAPLSIPKNGIGPALSYRDNIKNIWGVSYSDGIIVDFDDYSIVGTGFAEDPLEIILGGRHGDTNILYIQVNDNVGVNWSLRASSEKLDVGTVLITSGNIAQHTQPYPQIVTSPGSKFRTIRNDNATFTLSEKQTAAGTRNFILGSEPIYIAIVYRKDSWQSYNDDKMYATLFVGATTTTTTSTTTSTTTTTTTTTTLPPTQYDFYVYFNENIDNVSVILDSTSQNNTTFLIKSPAGFVDNRTFTVDPDGNYLFLQNPNIYLSKNPLGENILVEPSGANDSNYTVRLRNLFVSQDTSQTWEVSVRMPVGGGTDTINIDGGLVNTTTTTSTTTTTTTTTTTLPPCDKTVYVFCKQKVDCTPVGSGCSPSVTNEIVAYSCIFCPTANCSPSEQSALDNYVNAYYGVSNYKLKANFVAACPQINITPLRNCDAQINGLCEDFEILQTLDAFLVTSSERPLP